MLKNLFFLKINMNEQEKAIKVLSAIKGLSNFKALENADKAELAKLEDKNNLGVLSCLKKDIVLAVTHNSEFREPASEITKKANGKTIFPPVPFPELEDGKRRNIVSSSPSEKAHKYLVKKHGLQVTDEDATLLIGFDI